MSEIRVKSTGTIKLFESDNTSSVTIASPASLSANRTITIPDADVTLGAGVSLSGSTNNTVSTVTGANALVGEANLTYNGTFLGVGASADLGAGVHIKVSDTGASVNSSADELIIERSGDNGMTFLNSVSGESFINFGDSGDNDIGQMSYHHSSNHMAFKTNAVERMRILSAGEIAIGTTGASQSAKVTIESGGNVPAMCVEATSSSQTTKVFKVYCARNTTNGTYDLANFDGQSQTKFKIADSGNAANINNSYGAISDQRIKQNITDANSQWDDIKALKVRNFKLKSDTTMTHIGVVAQELEASGMNGLVADSPSAEEHVAYSSDFGSIDGEGVFTQGERVKEVKYSVLYMKSIKCLQEAMEKIETLEAKVTALENA